MNQEQMQSGLLSSGFTVRVITPASQGDPEAIAELFRIVGPQLKRVIRGRIKGLRVADENDIVQTVFMKLLLRPDKLDPGNGRAGAIALLCRIGLCATTDAHRKGGKHRDGEKRRTHGDSLLQYFDGLEDDQFEQVLNSDFLEAVLEIAFGERSPLDELQKAILSLKLEDMDDKAIAAELLVVSRTITRNWNALIKKLQVALRETTEDEL